MIPFWKVSIKKLYRKVKRTLKAIKPQLHAIDFQTYLTFNAGIVVAKHLAVKHIFPEEFVKHPERRANLEGLVEVTTARHPTIIFPTHETGGDPIIAAYGAKKGANVRIRACAGDKWFQSKIKGIPLGWVLKLIGSIRTPEFEREKVPKTEMMAYLRVLERRVRSVAWFGLGHSIPVWLAPQGTRSKDGIIYVNPSVPHLIINLAKSMQKKGKQLYLVAQAVQLCPAPEYSIVREGVDPLSAEYVGSTLKPYIQAIKEKIKFDVNVRYGVPFNIVEILEHRPYNMVKGKLGKEVATEVATSLGERILEEQLEECVVFSKELAGVILDNWYKRESGENTTIPAGTKGEINLDDAVNFANSWLEPVDEKHRFGDLGQTVDKTFLAELFSELLGIANTTIAEDTIYFESLNGALIGANGANQLHDYLER